MLTLLQMYKSTNSRVHSNNMQFNLNSKKLKKLIIISNLCNYSLENKLAQISKKLKLFSIINLE